MPADKESFVSRWSRRKQNVATESADPADADLDPGPESSHESVEKDIDPERLKAEKLENLNKLTDADMPDIDSLDENSDFSMFMSASVSEGLRSLALKRLFMGKSFHVRDGLDDYDGDYTSFEKMPSTMVTSDMKHMIEVEAKKKLAKEQEEKRQEMIASGELDETLYESEDEVMEEDNSITEEATDYEYVDEHINVDGFDTTNGQDGNSTDTSSTTTTTIKDTTEEVA